MTNENFERGYYIIESDNNFKKYKMYVYMERKPSKGRGYHFYPKKFISEESKDEFTIGNRYGFSYDVFNRDIKFTKLTKEVIKENIMYFL